jgi:hypothetical protein
MPLLSKAVQDLRAGDLVKIDVSPRKVVRVRDVNAQFPGVVGEIPSVELLLTRLDCPGVGYFTAARGSQIFCFIP